MNKKTISISVFMALLIISLPICFSAELNLIYDANGNLVTGDGKYREYNSLNQLWRVRNGSSSSGKLVEDFTYHPVEERILMKRTFNSAGSVIETVYYLDENFVRVVNSSGTYNFTYVYHEGQLVAQSQDGTKYFIHGDNKGSSTIVTNISGKAIENSSYSPFGELLSGGTKTRYDYEAKEFDTVVGDYDFNFRKYRADLGIFTQPDTLIQNIYDPQGLNRYMFERVNPYNRVDPTGHIALLALFVIGLVIVDIISGVLIIAEIIEHPEKSQERFLYDYLPSISLTVMGYNVGGPVGFLVMGEIGLVYTGARAGYSLVKNQQNEIKKETSDNKKESSNLNNQNVDKQKNKLNVKEMSEQADKGKDSTSQTQQNALTSESKGTTKNSWVSTVTKNVKNVVNNIKKFFSKLF